MSADRVLWEWDVPDRHTSGVTDDPAMAAGHVQVELEAAEPGAEGTVRRFTAAPLSYLVTPDAWHARREVSGVSWVSSWQRLPGGGAVRVVRVQP